MTNIINFIDILDIWKTDPVQAIQDIFNVRRADGTPVPLKLPEPQKQIIRDGILGNAYEHVKNGK